MGDNLNFPQNTSKSSVKGARRKAANMARTKAIGNHATHPVWSGMHQPVED